MGRLQVGGNFFGIHGVKRGVGWDAADAITGKNG